MNALHQAVTRAIRERWPLRDGTIGTHYTIPGGEALLGAHKDAEAIAEVAVRVVLAEATRSIEALRSPEPPADAPIDRAVRGWIVYRNEVLAEALAVLAALAEDTA